MIQNIIFDMGNVLLKYDPDYFVERADIEDEEDRKLLMRLTFRSPEWGMMDAGTLDEEEMYEMVCQQLPERLHKYAHDFIFAWEDPVISFDGMYNLISHYKNEGYHIYLLSNASHRQHEYWPKIPESVLFEGKVVSADILMTKPGRDIYEYTLDKFGLEADTCIFIDDTQRNIDGAQAVGIHGILFTGDTEKLKKEIDRIIEKEKGVNA